MLQWFQKKYWHMVIRILAWRHCILYGNIATVICSNQRHLTAIFKPENTDLLLLTRKKPTPEKSNAFCYHCPWSSQSWFYHFTLVWWVQLVMLMRRRHVAWRLSDWLNDACVVNAASQAHSVLFTGSQLSIVFLLLNLTITW